MFPRPSGKGVSRNNFKFDNQRLNSLCLILKVTFKSMPSMKIAEELTKISDLKVILCEVRINKQNPQDAVTTSLLPAEYANKCLVLVDDVLNSDTTLIYGVKHFLEVPLKKFKTAVLVDRNHKQYPVKADFKGLSLSTSLQEHIEVVFGDNEEYACLN